MATESARGSQEEDLAALIERIKDNTDGDAVSVGDVVDALGHRAFGSVIVITALIAILPTGAIPGMSILTGAIMLLLSIQLFFGANRIWLPEAIMGRSISRAKLVRSLDKADQYARKVDRVVAPRLTSLVNPPVLQVVAVGAIIASLSMFPLALVPFGALPAGLALLAIGLGLAVRDGALIVAGMLLGLSQGV